MELIPRMRTIVAEPGAPEVPMFTPAALPCNCCVAEEPEDANSSSVSITATEPVMSFSVGYCNRQRLPRLDFGCLPLR